jgi:hypothetical protein
MSAPARVRVPEGVLSGEVGGEAVLLQTSTGAYYALDPVGTRMWNLLAEEGEVDAVWRRLLAEYEVDGDELRRDLAGLVEELAARRLLEVDG